MVIRNRRLGRLQAKKTVCGGLTLAGVQVCCSDIHATGIGGESERFGIRLRTC